MGGAAGAPLSAKQKRDVCMLAREAWLLEGRPGFAGQSDDLPAAIRLTEREALDLWRHDEQRKVCGTEHLTTAQNKGFAHLMAHFAKLAGRERDARYWEGRTFGDASRQALAKLRQTFREVRDVIAIPEDYAASICRSKFKCGIEEAGEKQLWSLVFDMRRAAQHRRKHVNEVPF
jgi:hypothetical protein